MYAAQLGPGLEFDLLPPSPNGVDVVYSHAAVLERRPRPNLYEYVESRPTKYVDPLGLECQDPGPTEAQQQPPRWKGKQADNCPQVCADARAQKLNVRRGGAAWASIVCGPNGKTLCACRYDIPHVALAWNDCSATIGQCLLDHEQGHLDGHAKQASIFCNPRNPKAHNPVQHPDPQILKQQLQQLQQYHNAQQQNDVQCFTRLKQLNQTQITRRCRVAADFMLASLQKGETPF
jgi:hypothetical protein